MMTKFNVSSKMHLFIIISTIVVVIGLAVGIVCQFVAGGFFGSGADYSSYKSVTVQYSMPTTYDEAVEICGDAFESNGVDYYFVEKAENANGNVLEFRFSTSVDESALITAAAEINDAVGIGSDLLGSAAYSLVEANAAVGGTADMMYAGIALAAAVVFQFIYFVIRYKLTMAAAAFVADLHNLLIFYALLAITRVQVSISVVAISVFVVLLTMIGCGILFDRMRKDFRKDSFKAMSSFEQVDVSLREGFKPVTIVNVVLAAAFVLVLVFSLFAGAGVYGLFMPCISGILAVAACQYGTLLFTPSVYSRLKQHADDYAAKRVSKYSGAKKAAKVAQ